MSKTETNKNEVIILAIAEGGFSVSEAATRFQVSCQWLYKLLARYHQDGVAGLQTQSRRPHTNPNQTSQAVRNEILRLRHQLATEGLDAGPESSWNHLDTGIGTKPSVATIHRILKQAGEITAQPQKRPRSSWHRFQASAPNEMWQSDFTHWQTVDHDDVEIISWLDDHSRFLLHATAHPRITLDIVVDSFTTTSSQYGYPQSTLTDNGMVYTTRLAGGNGGKNRQPNGFEQLLHQLCIKQKNGAPGHPTTQGKIERYHQTLKKWLKAKPTAKTIIELQQQLDTFAHVYNYERPHRSINRRLTQNLKQ